MTGESTMQSLNGTWLASFFIFLLITPAKFEDLSDEELDKILNSLPPARSEDIPEEELEKISQLFVKIAKVSYFFILQLSSLLLLLTLFRRNIFEVPKHRYIRSCI